MYMYAYCVYIVCILNTSIYIYIYMPGFISKSTRQRHLKQGDSGIIYYKYMGLKRDASANYSSPYICMLLLLMVFWSEGLGVARRLSLMRLYTYGPMYLNSIYMRLHGAPAQ